MGLVRGLLFDNLGLKLVALLLAFIVYLHVYTERPASMMIAFPLELTDLADSLTFAGPVPPAVHAELAISCPPPTRGLGISKRSLAGDPLPLIGTDRLEVPRLAGPTKVELHV